MGVIDLFCFNHKFIYGELNVDFLIMLGFYFLLFKLTPIETLWCRHVCLTTCYNWLFLSQLYLLIITAWFLQWLGLHRTATFCNLHKKPPTIVMKPVLQNQIILDVEFMDMVGSEPNRWGWGCLNKSGFWFFVLIIISEGEQYMIMHSPLCKFSCQQLIINVFIYDNFF